jgi:hypothetical protein
VNAAEGAAAQVENKKIVFSAAAPSALSLFYRRLPERNLFVHYPKKINH